MFYFGLRNVAYAYRFSCVVQYSRHLPHVTTEDWKCGLSKMRLRLNVRHIPNFKTLYEKTKISHQ